MSAPTWRVCIWCREPVTVYGGGLASAHHTAEGRPCEHAGQPADYLSEHERGPWLAARAARTERRAGPVQLTLWGAR